MRAFQIFYPVFVFVISKLNRNAQGFLHLESQCNYVMRLIFEYMISTPGVGRTPMSDLLVPE